MGISSLFLALTLIAYLIVRELRDLLGKALICVVSSLLVSKVCTIMANLRFQHIACIGFGKSYRKINFSNLTTVVSNRNYNAYWIFSGIFLVKCHMFHYILFNVVSKIYDRKT